VGPLNNENNFSSISLLESVSKDLRNETRKNYLALAELLRHFWCCFPIKTTQLEEKVFY